MRLIRYPGAVALLLLSAGLTSAQEEVRITQPQKAVMVTVGGNQYVGTLHALNSKRVEFQPANMGKYSFEARKVKAVQTADKFYVFNERKGRFEEAVPPQPGQAPAPPLTAPLGLPATATAPAPAPANPFGLLDHPKPAPAGSKTQRVVAEGAGTSPQGALKDAFRNAVQQVVGAVVDSETLIKNDTVINDQVLTYSDGLVTGYKKISESDAGGLHRVKISADVERRSVVARLKAANVIVRNIDGEGLFAAITTDLDAANKARDLLENAFRDFPFGCLEADVLGKPEVVERDDTRAKIKVHIAFRVNPKAYAAALARLENTLKGIALRRGEFFIAAKPAEPYNGQPFAGLFRPPPTGGFLSFWQTTLAPAYPNGDREDAKFVALAVTKQVNQLQDRSLWNLYILDESVRDLLVRHSFAQPRGKIMFRDADANVITADQFPLVSLRPYAPYGIYFTVNLLTAISPSGYTLDDPSNLLRAEKHRQFSRFLFSPLFPQRSTTEGNYASAVLYSRELTLSLDEVQRTRTIKCEVGVEYNVPRDRFGFSDR